MLSLFQERESRDELGIGAIRDSIADKLFPGTSTIQTRLRYMLFVPWIYTELEGKHITSKPFAGEADTFERRLIDPLLSSDDKAGVFGKMAGSQVKRLPSSVYWAGLGVWGIRRMELFKAIALPLADSLEELCMAIGVEEEMWWLRKRK
jgi:hypothetical protein